jgi:Xaa-Pro aminopeptidase
MNSPAKILFIVLFSIPLCLDGICQSTDQSDNLPQDYLSPEFHAGRRQALRELMPANSVMVIFAYPEEVFSNDVNYPYHQNPDLYYFSGYNEPNAVLLIFREMQDSGDSSYNELFFVQKRNPRRESVTGKRLGVEGVKAQLGFKRVYTNDEFSKFPIDFKKFTLLYDSWPDASGAPINGSLPFLMNNFMERAGIKPRDKVLAQDLDEIYKYGSPENIDLIMTYLIKANLDNKGYMNDPLIRELYAHPDSATLIDVKNKYRVNQNGILQFNQCTNALRGIKTPEELVLLKKSVEISSIAHKEAMRAVKPTMSERELEGIMLYVHKKYGSETEGYPPIVGAGANSCILHYEENNVMQVKNQLVLMDVGSMYHGYSADITRTFPANGKFTEEQKVIYNLVYDAQEAAFKLCRPGISFDSLEKKTAEVLAAGLIRLGIIKEPKEVKTYYPHGMSHHLGLDTHDNGVTTILQENMVITVEPGIYIVEGSACDKKWWNIGVRIEDDVLITKNGAIVWSQDAPRRWDEVEKTIAEKSVFDGVNFPVLK